MQRSSGLRRQRGVQAVTTNPVVESDAFRPAPSCAPAARPPPVPRRSPRSGALRPRLHRPSRHRSIPWCTSIPTNNLLDFPMACLLFAVDAYVFNVRLGVVRRANHDTEEAGRFTSAASYFV